MSNTVSIRIHNVRVLLVDDYEINREVAEGILCQYGLSVDMASSGEEAIELCRINQYPIVFMDQMMPQMNGTEAMQIIRQQSAYYASGGEGKIVVLTADTENGVREELLKKGYDEYLAKPIAFQPLEDILVKLLPEECISDCRQGTGQQESGQTDKPEGGDDRRKLENLLPGVNVEDGLINSGGTMEAYLKILQMMCRDGKSELEKLDELRSRRQYDEYTVAVHALKGLALGIGAKEMAELARGHELAGKKGDYRYIEEHVEQLQCEYDAFLETVREALKQFDCGEEEKKEALTHADILQLVRQVLQCMNDFDFAEAARLVRDVTSLQMTDGDRGLLEEVGKSVDEVDIDKIKEILERCN